MLDDKKGSLATVDDDDKHDIKHGIKRRRSQSAAASGRVGGGGESPLSRATLLDLVSRVRFPMMSVGFLLDYVLNNAEVATYLAPVYDVIHRWATEALHYVVSNSHRRAAIAARATLSPLAPAYAGASPISAPSTDPKATMRPSSALPASAFESRLHYSARDPPLRAAFAVADLRRLSLEETEKELWCQGYLLYFGLAVHDCTAECGHDVVGGHLECHLNIHGDFYDAHLLATCKVRLWDQHRKRWMTLLHDKVPDKPSWSNCGLGQPLSTLTPGSRFVDATGLIKTKVTVTLRHEVFGWRDAFKSSAR